MRRSVDETCGEFDRFSNAFSELAVGFLETIKNEGLGDEAASVFFENLIDNTQKTINRIPSADELLMGKIIYDHLQIREIYENLLDTEIYLRRFPFRGSRIDRIRYMKFHITSYYNEIYILQERLIGYAKRIARTYSKSDICKTINQSVRFLITGTKSYLEPISLIRGGHVHANNWDDNRLSRVHILKSLSTHNEEYSSIFHLLFEIDYKEERKKWVKSINKTNVRIMELLDFFYGNLFPYIFDDSAKLKIPKSCAGQGR